MSEYIQSNNDSGNLAIYAGVGLAGAAGGAALTYRATRDPSNGKTAATGKAKASADLETAAEVASTTKGGKKMGMLARLFGGKEQHSSTVDGSRYIPTNPDLSKITSTPTSGISNIVPAMSGTVASTTASHTNTISADSVIPSRVDLSSVTSTEALGVSDVIPNKGGTTATVSQVSSTASAKDVINSTRQPSDGKRKQVSAKTFTSTEAVSGSNLDLSGVEQSVQARRDTGKKRSKKGGRVGKRGLSAFLK